MAKEIICNHCKAFDSGKCRLEIPISEEYITILGFPVTRYHPTKKCSNPKTTARFIKLVSLIHN